MSTPPLRTAHDRRLRDVRILASLRSGFSYSAIARAEGLSHERVRQIVAKGLDEERRGVRVEPALVQIARLEPALRLVARGVGDGELKAIAPLLKVLAQLDKYDATANMLHVEGGSVRKKLLIRLDRMAPRMQADAAPDAVEATAPEPASENLDSPESGWLAL
jgi:hypothetical protein